MKKLKENCSVLILFAIISFFAGLMSGCGSSGGVEEPGENVEPDPIVQTYNFTGTVYDQSGTALPGVSVTIFSDMADYSTDSVGSFAATVSDGSMHTILVSETGYSDIFNVVKIPKGGTNDQPVMLRDFSGTTSNVANFEKTLTSNAINSRSAVLHIPGATGDEELTFDVGSEKNLTNVDIGLEYIDLSEPLPVPLPSPDTLAAADIRINGKQAPSAMVSVKPALLKIKRSASLFIPNPDNLSGRILRFDPSTSKWESVGNTDDSSDGVTKLAITEGGIYGIFYEYSRTATVKGTAPSGSVVFIGDEVVEIPSSGTFYLSEVHVPPDGLMNMYGLEPETGNVVVLGDQELEVKETYTANFSFDEDPDKADYFTIVTSTASVKSDNSDSAEITVTTMDSKHVAVQGINVSFEANGGLLGASVVETDENGKATVTFSAGTVDQENKLVTIKATVPGFTDPKTTSVLITGTKITLAADKTELGRGTLSITVLNAGEQPIQDAPVTIISVNPNTQIENEKIKIEPDEGYEDSFTPEKNEYSTDVNGTVKVKVIGNIIGSAMLRVKSMGVVATQEYRVVSVGEMFTILRLAVNGEEEEIIDDHVSMYIGDTAHLTINAPGRNTVSFSTTLGNWSAEEGGVYKKVIDVPVAAEVASAWFKSDEVGQATIQVFDKDDPITSNIFRISIAADPEQAASVTLQSGSSVVPISTSEVVNSTTLRATVRNAEGQVVRNARVSFSIENSTNGGETVSPPIAYTDSSGVAESVFTSGTLGSDASGVKIIATLEVGDTSQSDDLNIIISGVAASIQLTRGTVFTSVQDETAYELPMSVTVSDANGNPVSGVSVSLSAWPSQYATGTWIKCDEEPPCCLNREKMSINEDANRNLKWDTEEVDANGDGEPAPPSSAAGVLPQSVTTGENGMGSFSLTYPKNSAGWIEDEITANTFILSEESRVTYKFWLPFATAERCGLPDSPYSEEPAASFVVISAKPSEITADGSSTSEITALVTDDQGNGIGNTAKDEDGKMLEEVKIVFSVNQGDIDSTTEPMNGIQTRFETYVNKGAASATLTSSKFPGTCTVSVTVQDITKTLTVEFVPGEPSVINLSANPNNITADGVTTSEIQAKVIDASENYVADGEIVNFSVISGGGTLSSQREVVSQGVATVTYTSPYTGGEAKVEAICKTASASVAINLIKQNVGDISLTVGADSIVADGTSNTTIRALVTDTNGSPIENGTAVSFQTTAGSINSTALCINGIATATLTSSDKIGKATVTATAGGFSRTTGVEFVPGKVDQIILTALPASLIADGESTSDIRAEIRDKDGNAVDDETITFIIKEGGGTLSDYMATTTQGVATVTYTAPSSNSGDVEIEAESTNNISNTVSITMGGVSGPAKLSIATSQVSVKSDNSDSATITATVQDDKNAGIEGITVAFSSTGGYISTSSVKTGADGTAEIKFSSGTFKKANKTVTITASVSGLEESKSIPVQITGTTISLANEKTNLDIEGKQKDTLSVKIRDAGLVEIYDAEVNVTVIPGDPSDIGAREGDVTLGSVENDPYNVNPIENGVTGQTDVSGEMRITVTGKEVGYATIHIECLGVIKELTYQITSINDTFAIINPVDDPVNIYTRSLGNISKIVSASIRFEAPDKIIRSDGGSFITDEFSVNSQINVEGSQSSNGYFKITDVSNNTITVNSSEAEVQNESAGNNITLTLLAGNLAVLTSDKIKFEAPDKIIRSDNGSFRTDRFSEGDRIMVAGSQLNSTEMNTETGKKGYLTLVNVSDNTMIVNTEAGEKVENESEGTEIIVTNSLLITVRAPEVPDKTTYVQFATSSGRWDKSNDRVMTKQASNGLVYAVFSSAEAATSSIKIFDTSDPENISDSLTVAVSAPKEEAAKLILQASAKSVPPSTGGVSNTVTLTATVRNAKDQVVGGAPVAFSVDNSTGGERVFPPLAYTDNNGIVTTVFTSGTLSSGGEGVTVKAYVVGRSSIEDTVNIIIGSTATSVFIGDATQLESIDTNTYRMLMTVMVSDANGNPVPGANVSLGLWPSRYRTGYRKPPADCGVIVTGTEVNEDVNRNMNLDSGVNANGDEWSEDADEDGELTPKNSAAGNVPSSVTTDEYGRESFYLTYPKASADWLEAEITATVLVSGSESQTVFTMWLSHVVGEECNLNVSPFNTDTPGEPFVIGLKASSTTLTADGTSLTTITATVRDTVGKTVADGTDIKFETTAGTLSAAIAETKEGEATIKLTAPKFVGKAIVTAIAELEYGYEVTNSIEIEFVPGVPTKAEVNANPPNLTANGISTSKIEAKVFDANDNIVADNELIVFTADKGTLSSRTETTYDGVASVTYTAPPEVGTGRATVTVKGSDEADLGEVDIPLIKAIVGNIEIFRGAGSIPADGKSTTRIRAVVTDINDTNVPDGTIVSFVTTAGDILDIIGGQITETAPTANGIAMIDLRSSKIVGRATVTATSGGVSSSTDVRFEAGEVASITLSANPDNLNADGTSTSTIRAEVRDADENAIDGEEISFKIMSEGGGILSAPTANTSGGVATVTLTAPSTHGKVKILAQSSNGTESGELSISIAPSGPVTMKIEAVPEEISVELDGVIEKSTVTVTITDEDGEPVPTAPVIIRDVTRVTGATAWPDDDIVQGNGRGSSPLFFTKGGTVTFTINNVAALTNCAVVLWNKDTNEQRTLLNAISPIENVEASGFLTTGTYFIEVDAYGDWIIEADGDVEPDESVLGTEVGSCDTGDKGTCSIDYEGKTVAEVVTLRAISGQTEVDVNITQLPGPPDKVELSADPLSIYANGYNTSTFTATVRDKNNNPVRDTYDDNDVTVEFKINDGTGTLENADSETGAATVKTVGGIATVKLVSPGVHADDSFSTQDGSATITASTPDADGTSDEVTVTYLGVTLADMIASPASLYANGTDESIITVRMKDSNGVAVVGKRVDFFIKEGTGTLKKQNDITDEAGIATTTFVAPVGGEDTSTVEAKFGLTDNSPSISKGISFKKDIIDISNIELTLDPPTIPADGKSKATVTAKLSLRGGGDVPDDIEVEFEIMRDQDDPDEDVGMIGGTTLTTAHTIDGSAYATITSGSVPKTVRIQVRAEGETSEIYLKYTPGSISLIVVPSSVLGTGTGTSEVTAILTNADGEPVEAGNIVNFEIDNLSLGTIDKQAITDVNGVSKVTFRAADIGNDVTVTASWTRGESTITSSEVITIQPPPAYINVETGYPLPTSINIKGTGGQSTSQISFEIKDSDGNLVADGYRINFSLMSAPGGGELIYPLFALTSGGTVSTVLRSGFKSGPVSIKAAYFFDSNISTSSSQIAIVAGQPVGEEFGIGAANVNMPGLWKFGVENTITINAADRYGNAIPDGTAISFKTYNTGGMFNPGTGPTSGGFASNSFFSTDSPKPMQGLVSLTAEAINGGRTTHITCLKVVPEIESAPEVNQILYAGTDGGGVYKSLDSGATWENMSRSFDSARQGQNWLNPYVNGIDVDPDNPNRVYAATGYLGEGRIYRSLDGGKNWNSNNPQEWNGIFGSPVAILTVLCDDDGTDNEFSDQKTRKYYCHPYITNRNECYKDKWFTLIDDPEDIPSDRYVWIGTNNYGAYYAKDGESFEQSSGLGLGNVVNDIVKVKNTNRNEAHMYAGTASGVYESTDGGANWEIKGSFTNTVNTLALYQESADIIYAGTEEAGVWVSYNGGERWESVSIGMIGKGLSSTFPVSGITNNGNGVISEVNVFADCKSENWTVAYQGPTENDGGYFTVKGSISGVQDKIYRFADTVTIPKSGAINKGNGTMEDLTVSHGADDDFVETTWTVTCKQEDISGGIFTVTRGIEPDQTEYLDYDINNKSSYKLTEQSLEMLRQDSGIPQNIVTDIESLKDKGYETLKKFEDALEETIGEDQTSLYKSVILKYSKHGVGRYEIENVIEFRIEPGTNDFEIGDTFTFRTVRHDEIATDNGPTSKYLISGVLEFTITEGSVPFEADDNFTFTTTRDEGRRIKDTLVDPVNNFLYAITYFDGPSEPHPVGNVYIHELDGDGYLMPGEWTEANMNLPQYDPPDDTTLFAQHVIAANIPEAPTAFFIGGDGINFYKASAGLNIGNPNWQPSKNSLENLIMARMPVVFTGECTMTIWLVKVVRPERDSSGHLTGNVTTYDYSTLGFGNDFQLVDDDSATFHVYVQDRNGNPPVAGSEMRVSHGYASSDVFSRVYPDIHTYGGTFKDITDPTTNDPFIVTTDMGYDDNVVYVADNLVFYFTSPDNVSGSEQREEFSSIDNNR
ncbi:MAG: hypothetical protein GY795_07065 [Desulfobacterales bacterium]|nr:hypothetical protein [Desulfobacterales bacterium]